jgi:hypothetical protein
MLSRSELEPWRRMHGLILYGYCCTINDLLVMIESLNAYKLTYNRHTVDFKLIFLLDECNNELLHNLFNKLHEPNVEDRPNQDPLEAKVYDGLRVATEENCLFLTIEKSKINTVKNLAKLNELMHDLLRTIYTRISFFIDNFNVNDDKHVNHAADYLKTPIEREADVQQTIQLQFKFFNKKKVLGRMLKHRADLYLLMNSVNIAFTHYFKAYNLLKNEKDNVWSALALLGK